MTTDKCCTFSSWLFVLDGMGVTLYYNMSLCRVIRLVVGQQQNIALPWCLNNDFVLIFTCVHFSKSSMSRHRRRPLTSGRLNWHLWSSGSWPSIPTPWCQSYRGVVRRTKLWWRVASLCEETNQRKIHFNLWFMFFFSLGAGFEKSQAELIVSALVTLTTANMDIVYKDMVTKAQQVGATCYRANTVVLISVPRVFHICNHLSHHRQEITVQQIIAHLDSIRKDMVILEKSEFANLRSENTVGQRPPRAVRVPPAVSPTLWKSQQLMHFFSCSFRW